MAWFLFDLALNNLKFVKFLKAYKLFKRLIVLAVISDHVEFKESHAKIVLKSYIFFYYLQKIKMCLPSFDKFLCIHLTRGQCISNGDT